MKTKNHLYLALLFCLVNSMVVHAEYSADVDNIFEAEGYTTALIDMGLLDSVKSFKTKKSTNDISGNSVRFEAVTTTNVGQLRDLLGDRMFEIDSLAVNGPIDNSDIETMWSASLDGELKAINLKNAVVEGNQIPEQSFFHCDEQIDWTTGDIYVIKLRTIIFPESIDYIGRLAFGYAIHLEELELPKSLRSIGAAAFTDCVRLKQDPLVFPEGFERLGYQAFMNCKNLVGTVILPSTIREIDDCAFYSSKITKLDFPEGLGRIGSMAFHGCRMKEVILPSTCIYMTGNDIFSLNTELESIIFQEGLDRIPPLVADGCINLINVGIPQSVKGIRFNAFDGCRSIKNINLPCQLEYIEHGALRSLTSLESLSFPATMKFLGYESCRDCFGLKHIYCAALTPPVCEVSIDESNYIVFEYVPNNIPVYVPVGTSDLYRNADGWNHFNNYIEIPFSGVETLKSDPDSQEEETYDLSGKRITSRGQSPIVISKGKKTFM